MHATLEYVAVGAMLILFLSVSFNVIYSVVAQLEHVREEQLYTTAERIMDKILLTTGAPPDWGSNISVTTNDLCDFGLALQGTRTPYEIDPDKVMRLANLSTLPNPLLINSTLIAELLGIKGEYGFKLEMRPLLEHQVTLLETYDLPGEGNPSLPAKLKVQLANWYGMGVPSANVTGIYVLVRVWGLEGQESEVEYWVWAESNVTDALGACTLDFRDELEEFFSKGEQQGGQHWLWAFVILHTNWYGFVSVDGYSMPPEPGAPVEGYIIGDAIFINRTVEGLSGAVITRDEVLQAIPEYESLITVTEIEWCRQQPNDPVWCKEAGNVLPSSGDYLVGHVKYIEKLSSHVFVLGKWRGRPLVVVISRIPEISITYGSKESTPANAVTLLRLAQLYCYPYLVRLTLWRWSEGWP